MVFSKLSLFCHLLTCSGNADRNVGFVASQITLLRDSLLSILLGGLWAPRIPRLRGLWGKVRKTLHQVLQKLWGSPEERFQQSFTLSCMRVPRERFARFTGPRLGPDCTVRPDCTVGARSAPIAQSGPVNCTKLASPNFAKCNYKTAS